MDQRVQFLLLVEFGPVLPVFEKKTSNQKINKWRKSKLTDMPDDTKRLRFDFANMGIYYPIYMMADKKIIWTIREKIVKCWMKNSDYYLKTCDYFTGKRKHEYKFHGVSNSCRPYIIFQRGFDWLGKTGAINCYKIAGNKVDPELSEYYPERLIEEYS